MDNNTVPVDTQTTADTTVNTADATTTASTVPQTDPELVKKNQELFARAKKAEEEARKLKEGGVGSIDLASLEKKIEQKVNLKIKGYSPELIAEIEKYAIGANIDLEQAEQSPFVKMAVEAHQAKERSTNSTPAPSSRIKTFNGKPIDDVLLNGTAAEKQAAFMAKIKGGVKSNE